MTETSEPETVEDGNAAIDKIVKEPTLDRFFDANPRTLSDDDLRELIATERRNRALFIEKKGR